MCNFMTQLLYYIQNDPIVKMHLRSVFLSNFLIAHTKRVQRNDEHMMSLPDLLLLKLL